MKKKLKKMVESFIFMYFTCGINFIENCKIKSLWRKNYIEIF
jgi:hypothetical protein